MHTKLELEPMEQKNRQKMVFVTEFVQIVRSPMLRQLIWSSTIEFLPFVRHIETRAYLLHQ